MWRKLLFQLYRSTLGAGFLCATFYLSRQIGPVLASLIATGSAAILCVGVVLRLRSQPPGKITIVNYAAGVTLPLGYRLGKGRLPTIVALSWLGWTVLAVIGATYSRLQFHAAANATLSPPSTTLLVFLRICWTIDALALFAFLRVFIHRPAPSLIKPTATVALVLAGSIFLSLAGRPGLALWLAAAPIVIVGGAYGLFLAYVLIAKPRWN
jgi:hypothetical protein